MFQLASAVRIRQPTPPAPTPQPLHDFGEALVQSLLAHSPSRPGP